jgi:hypothetical protein
MEYQFDAFGNLKTNTLQEIATMESDSDAVIVFDHGSTDDGRPWWAYIAVRPSRYDEYLLARKGHQAILLSDYGTVLKYGFNAEVPLTAKEEMKERYGFDEHFRENLLRDIQQAREAFLKQRDNEISDIVKRLKHKAADL